MHPKEPGLLQRASFKITLDQACRVAAGKTYWLEVQAKVDFEPNGQWFWQHTTAKAGSAADWKNPGDSFETGCTVYQNGKSLKDCTTVRGDLLFSVGN